MLTFDQAMQERGLNPNKRYRPDPFKGLRYQYLGTGTRRPTNVQILAAAERFENDKEFENANNMLELLR